MQVASEGSQKWGSYVGVDDMPCCHDDMMILLLIQAAEESEGEGRESLSEMKHCPKKKVGVKPFIVLKAASLSLFPPKCTHTMPQKCKK